MHYILFDVEHDDRYDPLGPDYDQDLDCRREVIEHCIQLDAAFDERCDLLGQTMI